MNESQMQAVLMNWAMESKNHQFAIPNTTVLYPWEADLVSATKAWLVHEMEIKLSLADFRADFKKKSKHQDLAHRFTHKNKPMQPKNAYQKFLFERGSITLVPKCPNYFWYATYGFDPTVASLPPYAGWLQVSFLKRLGRHVVTVEREAPRIHTDKMNDSDIRKVNRWLAFKLKNMYMSQYTGASNGAS
jgi:hypothetical protein